MNIGKSIKQFREMNNLTQHELSKATKIPQRTLSAIEQESSNPTAITLTILADYYGISIDELIGRDI